MRVTVLASGSAGNAILVEAERTRVLVDAGLAPRKLAQRMEQTGLATRLDDVQAVVCSHEHGDHASGVPALASAGVTTYCTAGTARALRLSTSTDIGAGCAFTVGALEITPVAVPHDAADPVMFVVSDGRARVGVLVDVGHADPRVSAAFAGCDTLVLETNHDADMLRAGQYPPTLKRRIAGRLGHLSNEQAAEVLRQMATGAGAGVPRRGLPRVLVLAHLSATNNRPRLARTVIERAVPAPERPRLLIAPQDRPVAPIELGGEGVVRVLPSPDNRQLSLAFPD
jgi:phosphoribosyl 1,2-cyclic phosphodiesterase